MVTRQQVSDAYRFILGREPESESAIQSHLSLPDLTALRRQFVASPEFAQIYGARDITNQVEQFLAPMDLPPMRVDIRASVAELRWLLDRIKGEWEHFGREEPHWSVLTHDAYMKKSLAQNSDQFYGSGEYNARIVYSFLARHGMRVDGFRTCFELGCGVGRITLQLASVFQSVIGADISRFHLDVCREELRRRAVSNVELLLLGDLEAIGNLPSIDMFVSFIVLQHNPPPVIKMLLDRILGRLNPGGVAVFHVPTFKRGYTFDLAKYMRKPGPPVMEMHLLPQAEVYASITDAGCRLLEVREDNFASGRSPDALSNTFFVQRP